MVWSVKKTIINRWIYLKRKGPKETLFLFQNRCFSSFCLDRVVLKNSVVISKHLLLLINANPIFFQKIKKIIVLLSFFQWFTYFFL